MFPLRAADTFGITIERERVRSWLDLYATTPLRYVYGPPGVGKTTALARYAQDHRRHVRCITLVTRTSTAALLVRISEALDLANVMTYAALIQGISSLSVGSTQPQLHFIIDNVDLADADAREILTTLYRDASEAIAFVYIARAPDVVPTSCAVSEGVAAVCGPDLFAFSTQDVIFYTETLGLTSVGDGFAQDVMAANRLAFEVRGRAALVTNLCREALETQVTLNDAVAALCQRLPIGEALYAVLDAAGAELSQAQVHIEVALHQTQVTTFAGFVFSIVGQPVQLRHARDSALLAYLTVQPGLASSRADLVNLFWPNGDRSLAAQCLDAVLARITLTICEHVNPGRVADYFQTDDVVRLTKAVSFTPIWNSPIQTDKSNDSGNAEITPAEWPAAATFHGSRVPSNSLARMRGLAGADVNQGNCLQQRERARRVHRKRCPVTVAGKRATKNSLRKLVSAADTATAAKSDGVPIV